jgi:hypothetical protein
VAEWLVASGGVVDYDGRCGGCGMTGMKVMWDVVHQG